MAYYEGEISGINGGNSGFGNGDGWWAIILFALIFGWGRGGYGGYGGGSGDGVMNNYVLASDFGQVERKLDGIANGICDSTYALNNTIVNGNASIQQTLTQGFSGLNTGMITQGYETRNAIQGVSTQLASCCCDLKSGLADINYNMARNTCDIIQSGNNNTQRIIDYLSSEKIATLQAENVALKGQISQNCQTATILNAVNRTPVPAYVVANPYCCNACGCTNQSIQ